MKKLAASLVEYTGLLLCITIIVGFAAMVTSCWSPPAAQTIALLDYAVWLVFLVIFALCVFRW